MQDAYIDPIMKKYADLVTASTKAFKGVFFGDPIRIATSELPALIISKIDTRVGNETNVGDRHEVRMSMTVVTDVRATLTEDKSMVRGVNQLYNLIEGRGANYQLKEGTLLYILRHNVELDVGNNLRTDLTGMTRVDYGMTMGKRQVDAWALEGVVEFVATFSQPR